MYLLIPTKPQLIFAAIRFTSHYVSINSYSVAPVSLMLMAFTSHYVSINSPDTKYHKGDTVNLHPTMYLLIQSFLYTYIL